MINTDLENASKIMIGSLEVEAIYIGSTLIWLSILLPYDKEIEYLESIDYQHIDTNIIGNGNYRFKIKFVCNSMGSHEDSNSGTIFGSRTGPTTNSIQLSTWHNGCFGYNELCGDLGIDINTEYIIEFKRNNKLYINNEEKLTVNNLSYNTPTSLILFALHNADGSIKEHFIGKIYYFTLYDENDNIIMDLIPVRKDGMGYMYDKVSEQLFGNQGTDQFILGPDKN